MTENSRIGISSACFYPEDATIAIKRCIDMGFENLEIFLNTYSELEEPYLKNVRSMCEASGVRVKSVHPFTSGFEYMFFFSAYKQRARDSIDYFVFHGDATKAPFFGMDNYCEVLSMLMDAAKSEGITLAHENVSTARAGDPVFMKEIHDRFGRDNIKFVFDLKQAVRAGQKPHAMLDAMGDDIVHVHINDWLDGECRLPYAGKEDLDGIIKRLEAEGYNGKYMIEVYRKNFTDAGEIVTAANELRRRTYN